MMRNIFFKQNIDKHKLGLEIGPLDKGICRKDQGYNVLILDVFSKENLLANYKNDLNVNKELIEEVDVLYENTFKDSLNDYASQESSIIKVVENSLNYIISSHNLEHFPNPIQFLIDVSKCLEENGVLNIAIPITTKCFDCLRPLSTTGELLDAYFSKKERPSLGNAFDSHFDYSEILLRKKKFHDINDHNYDLNRISLRYDLDARKFNEFLRYYNKKKYTDAHVWNFTLESFLLIFNDLQKIEIINNLKIIAYRNHGSEFLLSIKKTSSQNENISVGNKNRIQLKKQTIESYCNDLIRPKNKRILYKLFNKTYFFIRCLIPNNVIVKIKKYIFMNTFLD